MDCLEWKMNVRFDESQGDIWKKKDGFGIIIYE